ncbi:MAG TPA: hypothetical protein VED87_11460 [Methylocystis sp.]|nr:hypothetical protein [Methylocystis sp.]
MERKEEDRNSGEAKGVVLSAEQAKRRRLRNYAIGLAVILFMALIYAVTIIRLGGGAGHPPS